MFKLWDVLLGFCTHNRYTFPMRVKSGKPRSEAAGVTGIWVVLGLRQRARLQLGRDESCFRVQQN